MCIYQGHVSLRRITIYIYIYELGVYICNPIYTDILLFLHGNYNILVDQEMGIIMANVIWLYNDCNSL